jgi:RimJ/RimL family protein N-acetyltransferase
MIRLEKFPYLRKEPLEELYAEADQSFCLVHLPVPLPLNSTRKYLLAVRRELADGKPFLCYAIVLDDQIIGKIEVTKDHNDDAELDLIMKTAYANQGYGTEALRQLKDLLNEKH